MSDRVARIAQTIIDGLRRASLRQARQESRCQGKLLEELEAASDTPPPSPVEPIPASIPATPPDPA